MDAFERIERLGVLGWREAATAAGLEAYDWRLVEIGEALCSVCAEAGLALAYSQD